MKTIKKSICIILALVTILALNACGGKSEIELETAPPAVELNIQEYCTACESNKKLAEVTYVGNRYFLTGTIYEIEQTGYVTIYASNGNSTERFQFAPLNEDDVLVLSKGQTVTATGTLTKLPGFFAACFKDAVFSVE